MITLFDYQILSREEQLQLLYEQGVYIGKRREDGQTRVLYQLEGFYVEIWYRAYRKWVDKIHCFRSTSLLDPYLEFIDLEHIV